MAFGTVAWVRRWYPALTPVLGDRAEQVVPVDFGALGNLAFFAVLAVPVAGPGSSFCGMSRHFEEHSDYT